MVGQGLGASRGKDLEAETGSCGAAVATGRGRELSKTRNSSNESECVSNLFVRGLESLHSSVATFAASGMQMERRKALLPFMALVAACSGPSTAFKRTYPSGITKVEIALKNGVRDGRGTTYHPNGEIASQGPYRVGAKHGVFHYWNADGVWLKQELYRTRRLVWTSTNRSDAPPFDFGVDSLSSARAHEPVTSAAVVIDAAPGASGSSMAMTGPPGGMEGSLEVATHAAPRFLNALVGHGSFLQLTMGGGSGVQNSSANRIGMLAAYADGRLGGSLAVTLSRFSSDSLSAWGKPVFDVQTSYLLPYTRGIFVARVGVVLPLGNDDARSALAAAASLVQAPNDAIYTLPSTLATRGSLSWVAASDYVVAQVDMGLDIAVFGYSEKVHPIVHANGAVGVGAHDIFVAAEVSTVASWTNTIRDMALVGGALYASVLGGQVGIFAGEQDETFIFRGSISYDY